MPSLKANVPAKITINNPKAIKIISLNDSILNLLKNFVFGQSVNKKEKSFQNFFDQNLK